MDFQSFYGIFEQFCQLSNDSQAASDNVESTQILFRGLSVLADSIVDIGASVFLTVLVAEFLNMNIKVNPMGKEIASYVKGILRECAIRDATEN